MKWYGVLVLWLHATGLNSCHACAVQYIVITAISQVSTRVDKVSSMTGVGNLHVVTAVTVQLAVTSAFII